MSRKAGEIEIKISVQTAKHAVHWIRRSAIPLYLAQNDTLLTPGLRSQVHSEVKSLVRLLDKKVRRVRKANYIAVNISRAQATALLSTVRWLHHMSPNSRPFALHYVPIPARLLAEEIESKISLRRGRPFLTEQQRLQRMSSSYEVDDRHRKRIVQRHRQQTALDDWLTETRRQGQTILTSGVPLPKK